MNRGEYTIKTPDKRWERKRDRNAKYTLDGPKSGGVKSSSWAVKRIADLEKERDALKKHAGLGSVGLVFGLILLFCVVVVWDNHWLPGQAEVRTMQDDLARLSGVFVPARSMANLTFDARTIVPQEGGVPADMTATCLLTESFAPSFECTFGHNRHVARAVLRGMEQEANGPVSIHCFMLDEGRVIKETCILRADAGMLEKDPAVVLNNWILERKQDVEQVITVLCFVIAPILIFAFGMTHGLLVAFDKVSDRCSSLFSATVEKARGLPIAAFLKRCVDDFKDTFCKTPEPNKEI